MLKFVIATFHVEVIFQSPHVALGVETVVAHPHRLRDKPRHVAILDAIPLHVEAGGNFTDAVKLVRHCSLLLLESCGHPYIVRSLRFSSPE
jgi:hypothetical protein